MTVKTRSQLITDITALIPSNVKAAVSASDVRTQLLNMADSMSFIADMAATSVSSVAIGLGSKSFTVGDGKLFLVGNFVIAFSNANPANYMIGQITGYSSGVLTVNVTNVGGSGTFTDWTIRAAGPAGTNGTNGIDGNIPRCRVATTANVTIATALNNGDSIDGVTLVDGDLVLVWQQSAPAENGVYVVGAVPARAASFTTYNAHAGALFSVQEGTLHGNKLILCTSNTGGTINVTALAFSDTTVAQATTTLSGVIEIATLTEVVTGTDLDRAVVPGTLVNLVHVTRATVADDAVTTIPLTAGRVMTALFTVLDHTYGAVLAVDTLASYAVGITAEGSAGANIDVTTGALAPGGGTDGRITISNHTDDLLYISNRLGGSVVIIVVIFRGG